MQVVSIGTGLGDVVSISDTRLSIISTMKKMATTSKAVAGRLDDRFGGDGRYVRFNVEKGLEDTTLSDWKKASLISAHTRNYLSDNKRAVDKFVATFLGRDQQREGVEDSAAATTPKPSPRQPYRYIPFQKNRKFVGRTSAMNTLKEKLFGDDSQASHRVAIVGLGGVGKTQVALQVAYWTLQNKPEWNVFWVPALSIASFEQACREIAQMLGLEGANKEDAKQLLQRYLDSDPSGRWLLIVDNADDEEVMEGGKQGREQGIRDFLPRTDRNRILFTTRTQRIATRLAQSEVVDLSQMNEDEAKDLLKKSLGGKRLPIYEKGVAELLKILTYLPLAIVQAAAYLNETGISVAEYVRLLRNTERDMVELLETEFADDTRYGGVQNAVASTWVVSFEQIRKNADAAVLLRFIAQVESKAIPRSMLASVGSEQRMTRAIGVLYSYSFLSIREDGTTYDMHRLVHLASRVWVSRQDAAGKQRREVLVHLRELFSTDKWEERERWRYLLPHVLKAIDKDKEAENWGEEERALGYWVGRCLLAEGRSREAVKVLERVVAAYKTTLAETHPDRLASQHELAAAYHADGRVKEAITLLERVVAVRETTLAGTHPSRLVSQHNLAIVYYTDNQVEKAVKLLDHVVNVLKRTQSEDHPQRIEAERWLDFLHSQ
ncbi:Regulatory protein AfsR [Madurella mycetomatis]|uniref:Regulatory protein AfsR n=1 Tax=Madurella mycetomatis TaxID=100816 RepID=A0A175W284_9PEZI|nr:Regulatory protein AfsR [Madurella mycetomatis]